VIQASVGAAIHMVPVDEVLYFEAADKYVRVITAEREHLIRVSLRELLPQLDPQRFWQIHRGTVVRADAIATAVREESGKVTLTLRGHADKLTVSRLYAPLFKPM
jgi:DNA-binding LytR/AlgR family response regulator